MSPSKEIQKSSSTALVTLNSTQVQKASKALLSHIRKQAVEKSSAATTRNILDDADSDSEEGSLSATPVWLTLTTKRHIVDKSRLQPGKIRLPHPLQALDDEDSTICLITADPQRAYKNLVASDSFPAHLSKRITRVVDFGKVKAKFSSYEAQRKLFSEHDIFLGDDRIINRLPKVLGKTFYKNTQKRPIPVILSAKKKKKATGAAAGRKDGAKKGRATDGENGVNAGTPTDIAKEIERALSSALVSLSPTTNTAVRIGWSHWTADQIAENVEAVVTSLVEKWVPQKWRNVRSIYIKGPDTAALPIWLTDELWLSEGDVVADADATQANGASGGKKRKLLDAPAEEGKAKKVAKQVATATTDGDDAQLDKQIKERKEKLKKSKAKAVKALEG